VAIEVAVGRCTSPGRVRATNQDWLGEFASADNGPDTDRLFVLADGMGGEAGGEIASRLAVDVIGKTYFERRSEEPAAALERSMMAANEAIHAQATTSTELRRMGTTCTALVLRGSSAWVAHVGDSRAYRVRDGIAERLTSDHSLADRGPAYSHILTRALGAQPEVQVDITRVSAPVRADDVFLLCSDGLWGQVSDPDIGEIVESEPDPEIGSRRMVDLANARGGPDNITALLVRVERVDRESWVRGAARRVWRALVTIGT
jgi:serine/threonine protein phosphatase PrpC